MLKKEDIRIRDPFVLPVATEKSYYLYGTTDQNVWDGKGTGFDVYKSQDLIHWDGPFSAFRPDENFWADHHFWAPEVYLYDEKYYMFATFKAESRCRGTQILVSDHPLGPFSPLTDNPVTPEEWECLDGTLYIDDQHEPWMIFCHEWLQTQVGEICAIRLSKDLKMALGKPIVLFKASEANWPVPFDEGKYVTDGPFIFRTLAGVLLMLWSSKGENGYAMGVSRSSSGTISGPWIHSEDTLFDKDGGHGMLFDSFEGEVLLAIHSPNTTPHERPVFFSVKEQNGTISITSENQY